MNDLSDQQLLRDYAEHRSEAAFAELVRRHVDLVYSAALRMVRDAHKAEDVTQGTFIALARNTRKLTDRLVLSGWLHVTAQNLAAKAVRSDARRRAREHEAATMNDLLATEPNAAWERIAPHLDAALRELNEPDRDALLLRYFERKSALQMAQALGVTDEAAQKRVSRAVERLREIFARRGVSIGASGLAVVLSANAVQAAPVGLATTLCGATLAAAAAENGTLTLFKLMAATKLKAGAISTVILASAITSVVIQQHSQADVHKFDEASRQQAIQLDRNKTENARLSDLAALAARPTVNNQEELHRLQTEVAVLRQRTNGIVKLRDEAGRLQASLNDIRRDPQSVGTQPTVPSEEARTRTRYSMQLALAAMQYASDNGGQFPTHLTQAAKYFSAEVNEAPNLTFDQFEIVYTGSRTALAKYAHPGSLILVRQRQPWKNADGKWAKAYAFTDGSGQVVSVPAGNFEVWEKQHTVPSKTPNP